MFLCFFIIKYKIFLKMILISELLFSQNLLININMLCLKIIIAVYSILRGRYWIWNIICQIEYWGNFPVLHRSILSIKLYYLVPVQEVQNRKKWYRYCGIWWRFWWVLLGCKGKSTFAPYVWYCAGRCGNFKWIETGNRKGWCHNLWKN